MKSLKTTFVVLCIALAMILCELNLFGSSSASPAVEAEGVAAVSVNDFLNSIGAVSSLSRRGETVEGSIMAVEYTGLRWLRCGFEDDAPIEDFLKAYKETGVVFSYGLLSGRNEIDRLIGDAEILAKNGALIAIEGANEPNNWGITYQKEKGGKRLSWLPIAKLHRDLYASVKANPALKQYPVWATSETGAETDNVGLQFLTIPDDADSLLMPPGTKYADFANCHNYITHPSWAGLHDNQTWLSADPTKDCPVDGLYGNFGKTWAKKYQGYSDEELLTLPKVTTETGCHVHDNDTVMTEELQARMYLNLYLSQFKRGWAYTAIYLLKGRSDEAEHEGYAFYSLDYRPRQAAHYLHNFTTILADKGNPQEIGKLHYTIPKQPETTHDLLLQKSNGNFVLILWGERFGSGGSDAVHIDFGKTLKKVTVSDPTTGVEPVKILQNVSTVDAELSDHPIILEIENLVYKQKKL